MTHYRLGLTPIAVLAVLSRSSAASEEPEYIESCARSGTDVVIGTSRGRVLALKASGWEAIVSVEAGWPEVTHFHPGRAGEFLVWHRSGAFGVNVEARSTYRWVPEARRPWCRTQVGISYLASNAGTEGGFAVACERNAILLGASGLEVGQLSFPEEVAGPLRQNLGFLYAPLRGGRVARISGSGEFLEVETLDPDDTHVGPITVGERTLAAVGRFRGVLYLLDPELRKLHVAAATFSPTSTLGPVATATIAISAFSARIGRRTVTEFLAADARGVQWRTQTRGSASHLAATESVILAAVKGAIDPHSTLLLGLDANTGTQLWTSPLPSGFACLAPSGEHVLVGAGAHSYEIETARGSVRRMLSLPP